jgi:hypothetical protein
MFKPVVRKPRCVSVVVRREAHVFASRVSRLVLDGREDKALPTLFG